MPLQQTTGNVTTDAYGGGVAAVPNYIEDVFSSYLWTGNGTTQTITNGIDLSGKGGMVWRKQRDATADHFIADTVRGTYSTLSSNTTSAASGSSYIDFLSDGFQAVNSGSSNPSGSLQVGWTFRKQPKFFDVVTYTGNGATRNIAHNLGSTPGFMVVKCTSTTSNWPVYHQSVGATKLMFLNDTQAAGTSSLPWNNTAPTSTEFTVGGWSGINASGQTYVAYLFAHDAGGFGLTGTDNVISCGSVTSTSGGTIPDTNLGFEPQWILYKNATSAWNWEIWDNMRGWNIASTGNATANALKPNLSDAESSGNTAFTPTATGFYSNANFGASQTFIYIAIRRGPMKVPTSGTSVYYTDTSRSAVSGSTPSWESGFVTDMAFGKIVGNVANMNIASRLTGTGQLFTNTTSVEGTDATYTWDFMQGWGSAGSASSTFASWMFRRAPSYFDAVCYSGTGSNTNITHNLAVVPELIIVKQRGAAGTNWYVCKGNTNLYLNSTSSDIGAVSWWGSASYQQATTTTFSVGTTNGVNGSGNTFVAYLFATCAGVSKVGSYTGTGAAQTINCGFTGGARFVLIKCTNAAGAWYVWDSARGMVSGTDPYLLLNSTAAESSNLPTGSYTQVTSETGGFGLSAAEPNVNINSYSYIFLAIA